jgi:HAD superfamily hydrolase (TIGR01509 family)
LIAILDIDGTLVDTNYQHAIAWYRAFRDSGITLSIWRIHRHIGMGGDQMVQSLTDAETERSRGDAVRNAEGKRYQELIAEVEVMQGARELLEALREREHTVVLASSAKEDEVEHYLDLLDARDLADAWTSAADVEATKPAPDLVQSAIERVEGRAKDAVMVGDSRWDIEAAKRAGVPTLAVRTGGFGVDELRAAGASEVFESVDELRQALSDTPFG